jgi:outer membrane lipoprotein-sorting protein
MMSKNPTFRAPKTVAANLQGTVAVDLKETVAADLETMVVVETPNKQTRMWIKEADIMLRAVTMTLTVGGRQSTTQTLILVVVKDRIACPSWPGTALGRFR